MESLYTSQQRTNTAQSQTLQAGSGRPVTPLDAARANDIFDHFLNASTLKSILGHYRLICDLLHLRPSTLPNFYPKLKQHLTSWRAKAVWKKLDGRATNKVYGKGRTCPDTRVLIIGAGPCGLRSAIEAQMLGAKVVVLEKRDRMSRNNVLHLWPFVIDDLRSLGAKKFFGKFCAGSIDHISIRQLQCILLKVALLLGVEIHTEVGYESLVEPSAENKRGWRAAVKPSDHPVSQYEFDVIIGADGKRNTLQGFKRKEFRGKLAIAITANFINRRTEAEARVEEISGVAFIFNQKFFKDLYAETQIDLENIVYYKDDTHYFVMTAKKHSLLSKSVIRSDQSDTARLLSPDNVDRAALMSYAREAAEFSTGRQMLDLEFAVNHYGQPDVAMFDFTSMYAAENASRVVERDGYKLLCILVGDSLLEPFWPTGSGCARGFLSSLDAAWAIRAWGLGAPPLSVLAERESIYRLLGGTTPENLHRDSKSYSLDPSSRYPKLNRQVLTSHQVVGLYDTDDVEGLKAQTQTEEVEQVGLIREAAKKRRKIDEDDLISWIKKQVIEYDLQIPNLSEKTFKDGKILCAILHHYRPDLVDYKDLPEDDILCCHIAIELLEKEIGIPSIISPNEMATMECSRQQLISYLSQIYETFKREIAHINHPKMIFALSKNEKSSIIPPLKMPTKNYHSTPLNSRIPIISTNKKHSSPRKTSPRKNKKSKQLEIPCNDSIKKSKNINKIKNFSGNFHKSSTFLEKLDLNFIKEGNEKEIIKYNAKSFNNPKCHFSDEQHFQTDKNFKDKLLFHCPNLIIKNETNIETNYLKVWSVSDYLLIVPKKFPSLVKYFSDTTANGTKVHDIATMDNLSTADNSTKSITEIGVKNVEARCNILLDNEEYQKHLKFDNTFTNNSLGNCNFTGPGCHLILGKFHKKFSPENKNINCPCGIIEDVNEIKKPLSNNYCMRIEIKNNNKESMHKPCKELLVTKNNENNKELTNIQERICSDSNLLKNVDKTNQNITTEKNVTSNMDFMTVSNENNQDCSSNNQNNFMTLSTENNNESKTTIDNISKNCHIDQVKNSNGVQKATSGKEKLKNLNRNLKNSWILSKVLKYGAGKHTNMHNNIHHNSKVNNKRTLYYSPSPRSTVSDRIRTWLHTNDFDKGSLVGTNTIVNYNGSMSVGNKALLNKSKPSTNQMEDELKNVEELIGQPNHMGGDNCTDITGLTSVTKTPQLWGNRIIIDRSDRRGESVIRFGPNGEPVKQQLLAGTKEIVYNNEPKVPQQRKNGTHLTTNSNNSNCSAKSNKVLTSNTLKQHRSPSRDNNNQSSSKNEQITQIRPNTENNLAKSSPNVQVENKEQINKMARFASAKLNLTKQEQKPISNVSEHKDTDHIRILDDNEEFLDEDSNNSMEELAARLMDRFRGINTGLSTALADHNGGKVRVIQTVSNPFSAITEKDDDEVTPNEMPELKQHTLNALTGATATESPMHHRNFAGLRATPNHQTAKHSTHHQHHHHIRQTIPLGLSSDNTKASGAITNSVIGSAATATGAVPSSVATSLAGTGVRSGRKRKSASTAGRDGTVGGTTGLHVAQFERQQEIASNRFDRQARRKHHRRSQTEQFVKSMQMLQGNCKPDHSEPFEDYSLFVYRQTAPNFEDRVRDLEKKFIYIPDHTQNQSQLKNERDEDFATRIRNIEDKWYETTAQDPNVDRHNILGVAKKPKDLMRAIGKIETSDWNIREIEKKIRENRSGGGGKGGKERVPKWSREQFQARQAKMERKHMLDRQDSTNGKYSELDKNLKLLDQRLKEGTVRDLNQHKVAKITEKLKPKEIEKPEEKLNKGIKQSASVILPSASNSEYCHFCSKRVYLMEKLSAENRCFHRNCFRCEYCHTLLRPGAYKYDADGKYGNRFYCIHHYGFSGQLPTMITARNRHAQHQKDPALTPTNNPSAPLEATTPFKKGNIIEHGNKGDVTPLSSGKEGSLGLLGRVTGVDLLDRVQTPERIEFSNLSGTGNASSDHEEPPSIMDEDEWTDRNFGASTAEVGSSDEDDSYSDTDSEEEFEEAIEEPATKEGNMRILERYSRFSRKHESDSEEYSSSEQSSYCENTSGDEESDTATEGEEEIRARELRKQEVRLEPPIITDTGTDTEINSDDTAYSKSNEAPNSATEISTDSEFAQDEPTPTREIPSIVFNDAFVTKSRGSSNIKKVHVTSGELRKHNVPSTAKKTPPEVKQKEIIKPIVPNDVLQTVGIKKPTHLPLLNRLTDGFPLNRTQSTSGIAAIRSLELKKRYLLGETAQTSVNSSGIQKSGSASTLDSKLKSFHSNITDCQKMLKPTQEISNETTKPILSGDRVKSTLVGVSSSVSNKTHAQIDKSRDILTKIDKKEEIVLMEINGCEKQVPLISSSTNTTQPPQKTPAKLASINSQQSTPTKPQEIVKPEIQEPIKKFENELEGRPRSPVHETSIIVPKIDWTSQTKQAEDYSDSMSNESDIEQIEKSLKTTETPFGEAKQIVENNQVFPCRLADLEPLDSLNYIPSISDLAPKSISSEKKTLNQPKTLPGLYNKPEQTCVQSGRSTPTHGGNDSCITGFLTETELSDWARDGAVSDDFDYEYEHVQTSRKNKEPKKLSSFVDVNNKDDVKASLNLLDLDKNKSSHICGKIDDDEVIVECLNSILNPNLKNIEFMDTGSENSSCSEDDMKKNNGYVQFYNENDIAEDSLSPVINNMSKLAVLEVKNPMMTATIDDMTDFDELSTPTKNTGFCEVVVTPTSGNCHTNFGGKVIDLNPTDLEELKQKQTLVENEMDSLQVVDTGTEDNTCSDSTVKNVEDYKPFLDNNNLILDKKRLEDKLMQVKQDMINKKDGEIFVEHRQRLQSKISEFSNARDSIDVRKNAQKNIPKPDLIQQQHQEIRLNLTPTNFYQKETIAKERDINQRLIHEMILNKYKTENKGLERKKRSRNNSFSPKVFELSKSATTVDLAPQKLVNTSGNVTPDVILSTTLQNPFQKSQTMSEISNFPPKIIPSNSYVTPQKMVPQVQQVYTCYQLEKTPSYDKMRQEARAKARLLSDSELGLSPEDKILRLRERIRGFDNSANVAIPQNKTVGLNRANSNVIIRDTKSGMPPINRNSIAESQFNRYNVFGTNTNPIYTNDTLNSKKRPKSFRRSSVEKQPELTTSKSVQNIIGQNHQLTFATSSTNGQHYQATKSFKSDSNLLLDKSLEDFGEIKSGTKKKSKDRERRKSITKVISDFFVSIRKDGNSNLNAAKGFLAKISPKARERSKSCINLPHDNLVKETVSLRKSASSDLHFSTRDASPPPVPPLPYNYNGNKLEDSSDAELDIQRHCSLDNMDPALPHMMTDCVDSGISGSAVGSRRNSRGTAKRSARQAQLKRHRTAQEIQRKLEETEVKIRDLEQDGVAIEKRLRGESNNQPHSTNGGVDGSNIVDHLRAVDLSGEDSKDDGELLKEWFGVMRELTEWRRYERELVTRAEELELEDRHARLQNKLRDKLTCDTTEGEGNVSGTSTEAGIILEEMMDIVAKRDSIIANLEQDKQRYTEEDNDFEEQMRAKGVKILPLQERSIDSN